MGETCTQLSMLFNALTVPFSHVYSILYDSYSYYDDAAENYTSPLTRLKQRSEQIGENEFFFLIYSLKGKGHGTLKTHVLLVLSRRVSFIYSCEFLVVVRQ